jgi:hypothetical protein
MKTSEKNKIKHVIMQSKRIECLDLNKSILKLIKLKISLNITAKETHLIKKIYISVIIHNQK